MTKNISLIIPAVFFSLLFCISVAISEENKSVELKPVAICSGKYKKSGSLGFEIVSVRCPNLTDICVCEIDKKFNNQISCGTSVKKPSFESNLLDCETSFVLESR